MSGGGAGRPINLDEDDRRLLVTLDRPAARNAIDLEMVGCLNEVCAALEASPKVLVLTAAGPIFAAGADLGELRERTRHDALRGINSGLFDRVRHLPMPTIAAVNGPALGGGAELAYACDFRLVTPAARFANPEASLGILAAAGACWRLRELVGEPLANEMLLAGRSLSADEALACGLANDVVGLEELLPRAEALVDRILRNAPLALQLTKLALAAPPASHPSIDNIAQAVLFETEEKRERITAFLERSKEAR